MSYHSTGRSLVGKFKVKSHARERFKERKGEIVIGNKKIKNMNKHQLNQLIIKSLRNRREKIIEQDDGSLVIITKDFSAIVVPSFYNHVVTILP